MSRPSSARRLCARQLDLAQAKIRDLQLRMYGRKSERRWAVEGRWREHAASPRSRGQQRGAPGHARTRLTHLSACEETVELDSPQCPACGAALSVFPGTDDSEVLEIDVQAYRRVIRRRRYRCGCGCGVLPGIVTAPAPPRLIERGKFGISVWVNVLLDKFLYGRPSHRLLHETGRSRPDDVGGHADRRTARAGAAVRAAGRGAARQAAQRAALARRRDALDGVRRD